MPLAIDPQMHFSLPESAKDASDKQLRKACEAFEAFFVQSLFQSMRKTIPEGGLIERGNEQKWFEEFLDAEVSESLAQKNDLGLAQALYQEMSGLLKSGGTENVEPENPEQQAGQYLRTKG